jgi:outer membrane receptor protein involved in Fe transport
MSNDRSRGASSWLRAALISSAVVSAMASAQQAESPADETQELEQVIVTGSRIARPNLESTVPITSVSGSEVFETGNTSVGDLLNDLPALRSTFSQSNSSRFLGTTGLNLLDLRGLGTQRTLVLVNGRRHVGADILNNAVSPDTNTFPSDLIERIDVVTGGNSAVYGSDAIAGVVNFVLKRDYEGFQVRGQAGQSSRSDAETYFVSAVGGKNFADGRGNVSVNVEYSSQEPFFAVDRRNLRSVGNFVVVDTDPAGSPNGSDGVPDRTFITDIRSTTISNGGMIQFAPAAGRAPCGRDALGAAFVCTYLFQPDGSFVPQSGTRVGIAPNGSFDGGNGTTGREARTLGIFPELDRVSVNLLGRFEISDAFEPFIEAKYVRTDSLRFGSPAFFQGSTIGGGVDLRERPRFDNPFLSDAARATINVARADAGLAPATATTRFLLRRNLIDLGGRQEDAERETFRVVAGVGGAISESWNYEVALNYGKFEESTVVLGNLNQQRFLLAMDATRDAGGNIVCRSRIDPTAAQIYPFLDDPSFAQARLAEDVANCVPLNPFGEGSITPAMRNYLIQDTTSIGEIEQFVATAFVSGNSSAWFELPAGPVGVALGFEHRSEDNFFKSDDLVASGITFYNALPLFDPPTFEVNEVYGEVRVPVLSEKTMFHELTVSGAGRYSDYKGATGSVNAYNFGLDWAPVEDLRFRAGLGRAVRAPNLSDLFSEQSQNFAGNFLDPCSARNVATGSATRAANCRAAGIPATYDFVYNSSLEILSGGNPALVEETSDSLTVGAVFQPRFAPGLTLSVDYFDIEVEDVITAPTAQQIVNACYDAADLNNQFCALFQRAGAGGAPTGEEAFRILEGSLQQTLLNYAKRTARGIDVEGSYSYAFENLGKLSTRLVYTHTLDRDNFINPADPTNANQVLQELGDPEDAFNLNVDLKRGALSVGYQLRYIGPMVLNTYEDFFSVQGRPPENEDYADRQFYPSVSYHDVRAAYDFGADDKYNVYLGVDNLGDKEPPLQLTGAGDGSGIYEARGRFFYAGFKAKF